MKNLLVLKCAGVAKRSDTRWRALLAAFALACGEPPTAPLPAVPLTPPGPTGSAPALARVECNVTVRTKDVSCGTSVTGSVSSLIARSASTGTVSSLIVGGQDLYVKLTSSNVSYAGDVFSFTTTVQNLILQSLGTTNGTTLDAAGVRVFFEGAPVALGGSGTLDFINPAGGGSLVDGFTAFTGSNQAYYQYNEVLAPNQVSAGKNWRIHVPASVTSFAFYVYVSAEVQYPAGYINVSPSVASLKNSGTLALAATVKDVLGGTESDAVSWGTSDAAVATVNASSGVVTAVGDGVATITATSTSRTSTATITVVNADAAATTIAASPATAGSPSTVTVQAKTAAGANLTRGTDVVVLSASAGSLGSVTDNGDGTYTATLSSTNATTVNITGTINGGTIGHPGSVTFAAGAPATAVVQSTNPQSATVNTAVSAAPAVKITDANGNAVAGVVVTFAVTAGSGSVTGAAPTTNASGIATITSWTLGTVAGTNNNTLTATAASGSASTTFTASATIGAVASMTIIAGDVQTAASGAAVAIAPTVFVADAFGNAKPGVTVTFSVTGGGGSATSLTPTTDANGLATVGSWTLGSGGAGCAYNLITSCSRNKLRAVAAGGTAPAVNITGYIPPIVTGTATYQAVGNSTLSVASGIGLLQTAFSINGAGTNGAGATLTVTTATPTGSLSGTATIASNGSFTYLSAVGTVSTSETFTYTVSDGVAFTNTNQTLSMTVPERVWYVQPGYTGTSTGADTKPYKDFSGTAGLGVENVAAASDTILVLTGSGSAATGTLKSGQYVYGQGASVAKTFTTGLAGTYRNGATAITVLATATSPQVGGLSLGSSNTIRGFTLTGTLSGTGFGTLTVSEMISNSAVQAISLASGTLNGSFTSVTSTASANNNISMTSIASSGTFSFGSGSLAGATNAAIYLNGGTATLTYSGTIENLTALAADIFSFSGGGVTLSGGIGQTTARKGISVHDNTGGTFQFTGPIATSTGVGFGVNITDNSPGVVVNLAPASGGVVLRSSNGTAFNASGAGTISLSGSSNTVNATLGTAVSITGVSIGATNFAFSSTISSGGTNNVSLLAIGGSGSISLGGGALSGATGTSVAIGSGVNPISYSGTVSKTAVGQLIAIDSHTSGAITLSGNLNCAPCGAVGGAIGIQNTSGAITFSGGTKTITPFPNYDGIWLVSDEGSIDFMNGGLAITTTGTGRAFASSGAATLNVGTGANNNTISSAAQAIDIGATIGATGLNFASTTSTGGTYNVIMTNLSGSGPINLGSGSLSGSRANGMAFVLSGGAGAVSYSGTIAKTTTGKFIDISGRSAGNVTLSGNLSMTGAGTGISIGTVTGGTITFGGTIKTISTSTAAGVNLASNSGATVSFTGGGLAINTTTGAPFAATLGGTVNVTGTGNTISANGGRPLLISNVGIGASNATFQSIAGAGAPTNGIFLFNTGSSGSLIVTGNGGNCRRSNLAGCDGGTINSTSGSDGTTAGVGIYMNNTLSPSFTNMRITGTHSNFGIFGNAVSGLTLAKVVMDGTYGTTSNATQESAIGLTELSGTANISDSYIASGKANDVWLRNVSATLTRLTLTSDSLGLPNAIANDSSAGMRVVVDGGTTNVTVTSTTFLGARSRGFDMRTNSGTSDLSFTSNTLTNTDSSALNGLNGAGHYNMRLAMGSGIASTGTVTYDITNNNFQKAYWAAIHIWKQDGIFAVTGNITGNTVGAPAIANSGSLKTNDITVQFQGLGKMKTVVSANNLYQYNLAGLSMTYLGSALTGPTGSTHAVVINNVISNYGNSDAGLREGVHFDFAAQGVDDYTTCVGFGGNHLADSYVNYGAPYSIGDTEAWQTAKGTFKVYGMSSTAVYTSNEGSGAVSAAFYGSDSGLLGLSSGYISFGSLTKVTGAGNASVGVACDIP